MHALGVLGRYIPEFGRLTCLIQHEYYHRYTADEHVLRTIKHLDSVFQKKDPMDHAYEFALRKNELPELLYLILLLHDIGKSDGIKGHAESGVTISRPILERFQVSHDQQEKILFIIQNHLEMARFWQRFDIDDIQTAISFSRLLKTANSYVTCMCTLIAMLKEPLQHFGIVLKMQCTAPFISALSNISRANHTMKVSQRNQRAC